MAINKIEFGGNVLLDLSNDTLSNANQIVQGVVGHLRDGTQVIGTYQGGGSSSMQSGTYTPSENVTSFTVDTGVDFTHFLMFTTSGVTGNGVKALRECLFLFNGDGAPTSYNVVGTNNGGTATSGFVTLTGTLRPTKSSTTFTWSNMGTSGNAGGYLIGGITYIWYAW